MIEHHCLAQPIQSKLRRIVSCPTSKRILAGQAAYVDDVAAPVPNSAKSFLRTIENPRQIRLQRFLPLLNTQFRCTLENPDTGVVHQDIELTQLSVQILKEAGNFCAVPYIGNFCYHFTFRLVGELSYGARNVILSTSA